MSSDYRAGVVRGIVAGILIAFFVIVPSLAFFAKVLGQDYVVVNGLAWHLDGSRHCHNHFTPGLGAEKVWSANWRSVYGYYDNSQCATSFYAASVYTPLHFGHFHAGGLAGLVTGYRNSVLPAGGLALTYERERWGANLLYVPPFKDSGNVAWVQLKWRW